jgi:predicted HTH domain antitoxin
MTVARSPKPKSRALKVALPERVVELLGPSPEEAVRELQILAFIELFRRGEVSSGWAAERLGISRWDFIQLLGKHDVPYINISEEELEREIQAAMRLYEEVHGSSSPTVDR